MDWLLALHQIVVRISWAVVLRTKISSQTSYLDASDMPVLSDRLSDLISLKYLYYT